MLLKRSLLSATAAAAVVGVLAGCGGSDSSDAASTAPATQAAAAPAPAATTSSASSSSAGAAVNPTVSLTAREMAFSQKTMTAKAGKLTISLKDVGGMEHELVMIKSDADPGSLPVSGGRVSEQGSVGEIGDLEPGQTKQHTFDLEPGKYIYLCNVPGHYAAGMWGSLTVR